MTDITKLVATLVDDVIAAREALSGSNTQVNRRNLVRATLAAVEGLVWLTRQDVRETARTMDELTPLADLALQEQSYQITSSGEIIEDIKLVPITTSIRLVVRQAQRLSPELNVDFGDAGWQNLCQAIEVRNRITHPKSLTNLIIADSDLACVAAGFEWFLELATAIMLHGLVELKLHVKLFNELHQQLNQGDPTALAAYNSLLHGND